MKIAWHQALASIRVRFARHMLTLGSIALSSGFLTAILTLLRSEASHDEIIRLRWLLFVAVIMCAVGILNSMLISVAERIREIGIIKCLGAPDSFVVQVFVLESLVLGVAGSCVGCLLGFGMALLGGRPTFGAFVSALPYGLVSGIGLSLLGSVLPAYQSSKMSATTALRSEV